MAAVAVDDDDADAGSSKTYEERLRALSPISSPLADKKYTKKLHKLAKKASGAKALKARAEVTPLEKVLLIGCARLWAATAMSGTRGACVVSSDQAPRRARSMGARGSGLFNGVTQNASLFAFQRAHQRHSLHFIRLSRLRFARDLLMMVHPRGTSATSGLKITAELVAIDRGASLSAVSLIGCLLFACERHPRHRPLD